MPRLYCRPSSSVHPRAGGEHVAMVTPIEVMTGSSPRGRGTLPHSTLNAAPCRFIPARAGNTAPRSPPTGPPTVHPRAGGEHPCRTPGTNPYAGSSPRGRGTLRNPARSRAHLRFIPARAGNTTATVACVAGQSVHPRAGGEHPPSLIRTVSQCGSSPRGRGTPGERRHRQPERRFIPARAGNTSPCRGSLGSPSVHPRAGGEHRCLAMVRAPIAGSSPRGRGTPQRI